MQATSNLLSILIYEKTIQIFPENSHTFSGLKLGELLTNIFANYSDEEIPHPFKKTSNNERRINCCARLFEKYVDIMTIKDYDQIRELLVGDFEINKDYINITCIAESFNLDLIRHVVKIAGAKIFNLCPSWRDSVLHSTIRSHFTRPKKTFEKLKLLLELGAHVNFAEKVTNERGKTRAGSTPLKYAIDLEIYADSEINSIIQLLVLSGGKVSNRLTADEKKSVEKLMQDLFERANMWITFQRDKKSNFAVLPKELRNYIFDAYLGRMSDTLAPYINKQIGICGGC